MDYYQGNKDLPVYERPKKGYSKEQIVDVLCNPSLDEKLICSTHPVLVEHNTSFVIDMTKLKDRNDVRADDLGTWRCTGSRILTISVKCNKNGCYISKSSGSAVVNIRRQYHVHATDSDLHRMIAFIDDSEKGKIFLLDLVFNLCVYLCL